MQISWNPIKGVWSILQKTHKTDVILKRGKLKTSPNIHVDSPLYQVRWFQVTLRSVKGCIDTRRQNAERSSKKKSSFLSVNKNDVI